MSARNVVVVGQLCEAWNREDLDAARRLCDVDVVVDRSNGLAPEARVYRGREELDQFWEDWTRPWSDVELDVKQYFDGGDKVVAVGHLHARAAQVAATVDAGLSQVATLRGGKVVHLEMYQRSDDALEAARCAN
jgi:ketosteroid isomerase-like protein